MEKATRILVANRPKLMRDVVLATLSDQPGIEIVGEVSDETQILGQVQATLPDLLVIGLDEPEQRPAICDLVLRDHPGLRILAIASRRDRSICYWASFDIHSDDVEASTDGILSAVRNAPHTPRGRLCEDAQSRRNKVHDSGEKQVGMAVARVARVWPALWRTTKLHNNDENRIQRPRRLAARIPSSWKSKMRSMWRLPPTRYEECWPRIQACWWN